MQYIGLLDLYQKEKEKIEELRNQNAELRDELEVKNAELNKEKEKNIVLEGNKIGKQLAINELQATIKEQAKNSVSKDKIKAKIDELKDGTYDAKIILEQLLKEEK